MELEEFGSGVEQLEDCYRSGLGKVNIKDSGVGR